MAAQAPAQARRKVAFMTGITGQDGSYLTEFLLAKGYEVHGTPLFVGCARNAPRLPLPDDKR
jgi:hypothetical protein